MREATTQVTCCGGWARAVGRVALWVLLAAASVLVGAACAPDWRHSGAADTCGTSRDCGPADSGDATSTELPTISGAYRTNAALLAPARVALEAMAGVPAPKAEDIPLDHSGLPGTVAIQTAVVPAIGDLRADLGFVAATGRGVPDTMGAAGPTQYLVVLNSVVRSFNKATGQPDGLMRMVRVDATAARLRPSAPGGTDGRPRRMGGPCSSCG